MPSYIQNYGYTKTFINNNNLNMNNEMQWEGDYDGNIANINLKINDNGNTDYVSMKLTNEDIKAMLGIQPVKTSLEKRLIKDFLYKKPITLEGALYGRKTRNHNKHKKHNKKRKTRKTY